MHIPRILLPVLLAGGLAACASAGNESLRHETSETLESKLEKGKTTKQQVQLALGDPSSTDYTDSGNEIWKYQHMRATAKAANFIPVVDLLAGGQDVKKKQLSLFFDDKGILKNYSMLETESEVRTGLITANM